MNTVLFYFSATGNSLTTARMLAGELGNCQLLALAALKDQENIPVQADAVGFVFPVYYGDMPPLVRRVISNMQFEGEPYIFSVCTCRRHCSNIAQRLDTLLRSRGQKLSFSQHITMPGNSRLSTPEENVQALAAQGDNVRQAAGMLKEFPVQDYRMDTQLEQSPVHDISNMRGLTAEDLCVGCGICETVCPMENIHLEDRRAVIGEQCTSCLACFHWCPQEAIWMSKAEESMMRRFKYRHPDVTLGDIIAQKSK